MLNYEKKLSRGPKSAVFCSLLPLFSGDMNISYDLSPAADGTFSLRIVNTTIRTTEFLYFSKLEWSISKWEGELDHIEFQQHNNSKCLWQTQSNKSVKWYGSAFLLSLHLPSLPHLRLRSQGLRVVDKTQRHVELCWLSTTWTIEFRRYRNVPWIDEGIKLRRPTLVEIICGWMRLQGPAERPVAITGGARTET